MFWPSRWIHSGEPGVRPPAAAWATAGRVRRSPAVRARKDRRARMGTPTRAAPETGGVGSADPGAHGVAEAPREPGPAVAATFGGAAQRAGEQQPVERAELVAPRPGSAGAAEAARPRLPVPRERVALDDLGQLVLAGRDPAEVEEAAHAPERIDVQRLVPELDQGDAPA